MSSKLLLIGGNAYLYYFICCVSSVSFVSVKPFFNKEPQDIVTVVGQRVVFQCAVEGEPSPAVLWRREDGKMPIGRARILDNKSLLIDNVQTSDEGLYICAAENLVGSITTKASLVVNCKWIYCMHDLLHWNCATVMRPLVTIPLFSKC